MGEYIRTITTHNFDLEPVVYLFRVTGENIDEFSVDSIALVSDYYHGEDWPDDRAWRESFFVATNRENTLEWKVEGTGTWNTAQPRQGTWDGNTYLLNGYGTFVSYGLACPNIDSDLRLAHCVYPTPTSQGEIDNLLAGMLNGYASDILTSEEWDNYQIGAKNCHWTIYKDGATFYLTWNSPYIEESDGTNHVFPYDVEIEYKVHMSLNEIVPDGDSNLLTRSFTDEPYQFNIKSLTNLVNSSGNKPFIEQLVTKSIAITQWNLYMRSRLEFRLTWKERDESTGSESTIYTDWCNCVFNGSPIVEWANNQFNKGIEECVTSYTPRVDDGSTVTLKDGYYADDPDYSPSGNAKFPTDNDYEDPTIDSDTIGTSTAYGSNNLMTTTYAMTEARLRSLNAFLWGNDFDQLIHKINNSPIENIVSLKCFPFDLAGIDEEIYLGNVQTNVNGAKIADNYRPVLTVGEIELTGLYGNFLDLPPYTKCYIFLAFVGLKEINLALNIGKTLRVELVPDLTTGTACYNLYYDDVLSDVYECNIAFDIPLTSSNRAQVQGAIMGNLANTAVVAVAELATENYLALAGTLISAGVSAATAKVSTQTSGAFSADTWSRMPRTCFLLYDRPTWQDLALFNHAYGRMCNLSKQIGSLTGFTKISNVDLTGIHIATEDEASELRQIMNDGFYC